MPQNLPEMTDYYKVTKQLVVNFLIFYKLGCLHILWHMKDCKTPCNKELFQAFSSLVLEVLGGRQSSLKNLRFSFSQWQRWTLKSFCSYCKAFQYKVELTRISCKWSLDEDITHIIMHFFLTFTPSAPCLQNSSKLNQANDRKCTFMHSWLYHEWRISVKNQYVQWYGYFCFPF